MSIELSTYELYNQDPGFKEFIDSLPSKTLYDPGFNTLETLNSQEEPKDKAAIAGLLAATGGVGSFWVGAVIIVAIGVLLYTLTRKEEPEEREEEYYKKTWGFDSSGSLVDYGLPIPIIYGKRGEVIDPLLANGNPFGGIRYNGSLINSFCETVNGRSTLTQLFALSVGKLGSIDFNETYVNDVPVADLYGDVTLFFGNGANDQPVFTDSELKPFVPFFSQMITPSVNIEVGVEKVIEKVEEVSYEVENYLSAPSTTPTALIESGATSVSLARNDEAFLIDCTSRVIDPAEPAGGITTTSTFLSGSVAIPDGVFPLAIAPITTVAPPTSVGKPTTYKKARTMPQIFWQGFKLDNTLNGPFSYISWKFISPGDPAIVIVSPSNALSTFVSNRNPDSFLNSPVGGSTWCALAAGAYNFLPLDTATERACDFNLAPPSSTGSWRPLNGISSADTLHVTWLHPVPPGGAPPEPWHLSPIGSSGEYRIIVNEFEQLVAQYKSGSTWVDVPNPGGAPMSAASYSGPYYIWVYLINPLTGIKDIKIVNNLIDNTGSMGGISVSTTEFTVDIEDNPDDETTRADIERFSTTEIYRFTKGDDSTQVHEFRVKEKKVTAEQIVGYPAPSPSFSTDDMNVIYRVNRGRYTTTKRVTELWFNCAYTLFSRPKPTSDEVNRGKKGGKGGK